MKERETWAKAATRLQDAILDAKRDGRHEDVERLKRHRKALFEGDIEAWRVLEWLDRECDH